jgi:hypothetical protein
MRDIFIFDEIWAQDIYFGRYLAWMKHFTSSLTVSAGTGFEL